MPSDVSIEYQNFQQLLNRSFQHTSFFSRLFLFLRWNLTPYPTMAAHLPQIGNILDLACGHGLFSLFIAYTHPSCEVDGLDHDVSRVHFAKEAGKSLKNLKFQSGDLREKLKQDQLYSGISIIDALHYFPSEEQTEILRLAYQRLSQEGILIIREVDRTEGIRSHWNSLYEKLATGLKFTKAHEQSCTFRSPKQWTELLESIGFSVSSKRCSSVLFSDVLFVAAKK